MISIYIKLKHLTVDGLKKEEEEVGGGRLYIDKGVRTPGC